MQLKKHRQQMWLRLFTHLGNMEKLVDNLAIIAQSAVQDLQAKMRNGLQKNTIIALNAVQKWMAKGAKMVRLTQSLEHWLWENHRDIIGLIMLGHTELFTEDMQREYIEWCKTDEGRQYLKGGSKYKEMNDGT
jgi:hypothetical protein